MNKIVKKIMNVFLLGVVSISLLTGTTVSVHADDAPNYSVADQEAVCDYYVIMRAYAETGINLDNLWSWTEGAKAAGFTVDTTPRGKSVAIYSGHVAWVESVNGDKMTVTEGGYYDSGAGRKIIHTGDVPTTIGGEEYPGYSGSPVLKAFLHLDVPRNPIQPNITTSVTNTSDVTKTEATIQATFLNDSTSTAKPTDAGCFMSENYDAVKNATVDSHDNVMFGKHSDDQWGKTNGSDYMLNSYTNQYTYIYHMSYEIFVSSANIAYSNQVRIRQDLKEGTVYYYKTYVTTDQNTVIYSNTEKIRTSSDNILPMYRMYNPNSGEHFYTQDENEKKSLVRAGWNFEGYGWYAPRSSSTPVYRVYNPNAGDHHYTLNANEKDSLVAAGWIYEGIGWYSDDAKSVPLYRQYNPNAVAGAHNYTVNANERDMLVGAGWNDEGIGWYGCN